MLVTPESYFSGNWFLISILVLSFLKLYNFFSKVTVRLSLLFFGTFLGRIATHGKFACHVQVKLLLNVLISL